MSEAFDALIKQHIERFVAEQESLVARFIKHTNCTPDEMEIVSEHRGMSIVVYPRLRNYESELQQLAETKAQLEQAIEVIKEIDDGVTGCEQYGGECEVCLDKMKVARELLL